MYRTAKGEEIFVIDGHTHFWDGSPAQPEEHPRQAIHRVLLCLSLESQSAIGEMGKGKV